MDKLAYFHGKDCPMQMPTNIIDLLIEHDTFRVCRLMSTTEFVRFCTERKLSVSPQRLRRFEQLGIFQPLFRVYLFDIVRKIETVQNGQRDLGILEEGEVWAGETCIELANFDPAQHLARNWQEHG